MATFRPSESESINHPPTDLPTLLTQDKDEVELEIKPGVAGLTWIGAKVNKELCNRNQAYLSISIYDE